MPNTQWLVADNLEILLVWNNFFTETFFKQTNPQEKYFQNLFSFSKAAKIDLDTARKK